MIGESLVDLSVIIMIVGILCIIVSFFINDSTKRVEQDVEELSINIYQETNNLKRRLKIVEEELLLEPNFQVKSPNKAAATTQSATNTNGVHPSTLHRSPQTNKPINSILMSQVLELNKQGLAVNEISKLSTLSEEQVFEIITKGGRL